MMQKNYRLVCLCAAALLFSTAAPAEMLLSPDQFTREYVETLKAHASELNVRVVGNLELKIKPRDGGDYTIYLDNAYALYKQNPANKDAIIRRYIAGNLETTRHEEGSVDLALVVPVIKSRDWLDNIQRTITQQNRKQPTVYPHDRLTRDLIVIYAQDAPNTIQYLSQHNLDKAGISVDRVRDMARNNLKRLFANTERATRSGIIVIRSGSSYEPSLLLWDEFWKREKFPIKGEIVVAVPNRDVVYVTGSREPENIALLRRLARMVYDQDPYRLSRHLYIYRQGRWLEF